MDLKFAGIGRKTEFSPNHVMNDHLILQATADELTKLGATVKIYDEGILNENSIDEEFVFSMVQGPKGIQTLRKIQAKKKFVINSADAVYNCYRFNMTKKLLEAGIPFPYSVIVNTQDNIDKELEYFKKKFWVKRGDAHAVHKEDVTLVYNKDETRGLMQEFYQRDIEQAILQEHLTGDTVKFYAVKGTNLFYWYHLNGDFHTPFDEKRLNELANDSAEILGLHVFGGDAIITPKSEIIIIDINDWPSFAPVRAEASREIAQLLIKKGLEND